MEDTSRNTAARGARPGGRLSADGSKLGRELWGLLSVFFGLLVILSLATFDGRDPWLNHVVSGALRVHNKAGLFGAYLAGLLYDILGAAAWAIPAWLCIAGVRRILNAESWPWWRWTGFVLLGLSLCLAGAARDLGHVEVFARGVLPPGSGNVSSHGGGLVGHVLYVGLVGWMGPVGAFLVWFFSLAVALQMLSGISLPAVVISLARSGREFALTKVAELRQRRAVEKDMQAMELAAEARPAALPPLAVTVLPRNDAESAAGAQSAELLARAPFEPEPPVLAASSGDASPDAVSSDIASPGVENQAGQDMASLFPADSPYLAENAAKTVTGTGAPDAAAAAQAPTDALVHPLVPRPEAPAAAPEAPAFVPREDTVPDLFRPGGATAAPEPLFAADDDEDLPPWVRDFEQDRVGVPPALARPGAQGGEAAPAAMTPTAPATVPVPGPISGPATSPAATPVSGPTAGQAAGATTSPATGATTSPATTQPLTEPPVPQDDSDLLDIVWGREEKAAPSSVALTSSGQQASAPDSGPHSAQAAHGEDIADSRADSGAVIQSAGRDTALSPQTAAAVEALRAAAFTGPDLSLKAGPDALSLEGALASLRPEAAKDAASAASAALVPDVQAAVPAGAPAASPHAPAAAPPAAPEDDIHIYEAPPVAQAAAPGLAQKVVQRIVRPRRAALPPLDLLKSVPLGGGGTPRAVLEEKGRSLMTCLKDFGIQGELVGITPGPVVTMFEVRPAPGVRVSRIANLSDDLALALKAVAVRIQAPVPGTDTVGIEIPNEIRETVYLKELLGSQTFSQAESLLTLALGKDIAGHPAVANLATMPHLLVAGATGAGKSVGINSIILSFLYKARPEEVKLLLVDPKRVEMAIYADLPHLVHPVVTEMQLAKNALDWAVAEMERRYNDIATAGVRNIADYNAKVAAFGASPPQGMEHLEFMPYLVIIIDELADLMLVAAKEVETSIVRLAQLARAAGIHLILATQRPSVDVVTGLIKANFPCRISFQVTSKHDSRTILDSVGAEHLLGKGDMLFKPSGGKFVRMHGAFVSDHEVNAVVSYWRAQQPPDYKVDFADWAPEGAAGAFTGGGGNGNVSDDPLYNEAVDFVRQQGKASISLIQRKFRIGFNKAARYVEQMEVDGIIGPADGSKPRIVIG